jgi:hypothetical protein
MPGDLMFTGYWKNNENIKNHTLGPKITVAKDPIILRKLQ